MVKRAEGFTTFDHEADVKPAEMPTNQFQSGDSEPTLSLLRHPGPANSEACVYAKRMKIAPASGRKNCNSPLPKPSDSGRRFFRMQFTGSVMEKLKMVTILDNTRRLRASSATESIR